MSYPKVHTGFCLLCRILSRPVLDVGLNVLVEDTCGNVNCASLYNVQLSLDVDAHCAIPQGTLLAVKEPYLKDCDDGVPYLTVESPTDIVLLHPSDELLQGTSWYEEVSLSFEELKARGNDCYGREAYGEALQWYDLGLKKKPADSVCHLNRAAALLELGQFFEAYQAVQSATEYENSEVNQTARLQIKALLRLGEAAYGMRDWQIAADTFLKLKENHETGDRYDSHLARARARLHESQTGEYDMKPFARTCGSLVKHDAADYTGPVSVEEIPGKGQGLVAATDIKRGTLLLVSKAFAMAPPDKSVGLSSPGPRFLLLLEILNRFCDRPRGTSELYRLDSDEIPRDIPLPDGVVDVNRIQKICWLNQVLIDNEFAAREAQRKDSEDLPCGIWIFPSFINHSCDPNAIRICYGDVMMVRALRDIRQGEEIVVDYVRKAADPRSSEMIHFNFKCQCARCAQDAATGYAVAKRRKRAARMAHDGVNEEVSSAEMKHLVRAIEETYESGDRFREALFIPQFGLGQTLLNEGRFLEAVAAYNQAMELEPRPLLGVSLTLLLRRAEAYLSANRVPETGRALAEFLRFARETTGLWWPELKIAAPECLKYLRDPAAFNRILETLHTRLCTLGASQSEENAS
jgi:tetratricopeptide (TPR) repeat protein